MDDRYVIPLPDFKYDHQALFNVQDNNENYVANPHFKKSRNLDIPAAVRAPKFPSSCARARTC